MLERKQSGIYTRVLKKDDSKPQLKRLPTDFVRLGLVVQPEPSSRALKDNKNASQDNDQRKENDTANKEQSIDKRAHQTAAYNNKDSLAREFPSIQDRSQSTLKTVNTEDAPSVQMSGKNLDIYDVHKQKSNNTLLNETD